MGAVKQGKRKKTAREVAEKFGISSRTVRRIFAQPRADFLAEAERRQRQAQALREQGLKYVDISEKLGVSVGAAKVLVHRARTRDKPKIEPETPQKD
jgi:DNA-directed RNA polymerase specialized sigma24 family protein